LWNSREVGLADARRPNERKSDSPWWLARNELTLLGSRVGGSRSSIGWAEAAMSASKRRARQIGSSLLSAAATKNSTKAFG
jgi:hypothetical protein